MVEASQLSSQLLPEESCVDSPAQRKEVLCQTWSYVGDSVLEHCLTLLESSGPSKKSVKKGRHKLKQEAVAEMASDKSPLIT